MTETALDTCKKPVKGNGYSYKIDVDKAIQLRCKGLSYADIAKHFDVTGESVRERIGGLVNTDFDLEAFKKNRADILSGKQLELLKSLTEDDIKKASPYQKVGMFSLLYDKERLERGESTSNIAYADLSDSLRGLQQEEEALMADLGASDFTDLDDLDLDDLDQEIREIEEDNIGNTLQDEDKAHNIPCK